MPSDSNSVSSHHPGHAAGEQAARPPRAAKRPAPPCTVVIFGAGGDLTRRLLIPALYHLALEELLDDSLQIIGVSHGQSETTAWRDELLASLQQSIADKSSEAHTDQFDRKPWDWLAQRLQYQAGEFEDDATYTQLKQQLDRARHGNVIFYLAVGAQFFQPIVEHLGKAGLLEQKNGFRRLIVEKPFGSDLASARELNAHILRLAQESQVYRIDHFLGKDTVQSILAVRFANAMFEPIWRREYIDSVQITAAETLGVEGRGPFYERTGALRDMVPNHLFQLLAVIALEPPNSFDAEAVRDKKVELFEAIEPLKPDDVVLGQYEAGPAGVAYRDEPNVAPDSATETYVAARLQIDNWRWAGVPFYLRTGKRLATRRTEIAVQLKRVPFLLFRDTPVEALTPNMLTLHIDPSHGTSFDFHVKVPGPTMRIGAARSSFDYGDSFPQSPNVGYETLLYDCMLGDATLFQRADGIDASWAAVDRILHPQRGTVPVHGYAAGSDGPAQADALLARDGRAWRPLDE